MCLVDHQQTSQMNPSINPDSVVGVIDHHALQSKTIVTDRPIYIDIRPWGSMSTIVAHTYLTHGRRPSTSIAGMLLCAILSDTLNLQGPTTTEWDRMMVAVETTDDAVIIDRLEELLPELVACKKERKLDVLFLAVVNIVQLKGTLVICGPSELSLAVAAFGKDAKLNDTGTIMDLGNRVSRKKDYIPEITRAIKNGWAKPPHRGLSVVDVTQLGTLEVDPLDPFQKVVRKGSVLLEKGVASPISGGKGMEVSEEEKKVDA